MTWTETLGTQARHHHRCWSELIAQLGPKEARFRLDPKGPSIAWLLGHCCEEADSSVEAILAQPRVLGVNWAPGRDWMTLTQGWSRVSEQLLAGLASLKEHDLDQPCGVAIDPVFAGSLTNRRVWLQGHVFHLAYHLGQAQMLQAASKRIPPEEG